MKRKRFSVEQIVAVLKQAELGMPVADIIRKIGISERTWHRWKKQCAGMQSDQVRELNCNRGLTPPTTARRPRMRAANAAFEAGTMAVTKIDEVRH